MELLWFLIIGAAAGWLAGVLMKQEGSLVRNLVVGVVGAYLGGWLLPQIGVSFAGDIGQFITATIGAVLLLFIISKVAK